MIPQFFIDRPILASVLSIVTIIIGSVALLSLPIAQYPEVVPPTIQVSAMYPGANAKVVADTVAAPIEQEVNGVENMLYMFSKSTNDGQMYLDVTFNVGADLNMAQVLVQNSVAIAEAKLPEEVKRQGVTTKKKSPAILLCVNLISPDQRYDQLYLSNYATIQVNDALARLPGIGDVTFLGARDYSMRVWLDPEKLASQNLSASDVTKALREQNVQVAAGRLGQPPAPAGQAFQLAINTLGRLLEPEQFADIIIKTGEKGQVTRIRDVGRTELGAKNYDVNSFLDDQPSITLAVFQLPGSNALATAESVKAKMEELKSRFPDGLDYKIVYDTTVFVDESIHEVYKTLIEAFILVFVVVLVFLQNWRATIIPMVAVPVSLIGTLAVMAGLGFSLNNLSLFGLVLAIGIVVDDAIVVVESVELNMASGLNPKEATRKSMKEVSGALIAIALVLCSVFIPTCPLNERHSHRGYGMKGTRGGFGGYREVGAGLGRSLGGLGLLPLIRKPRVQFVDRRVLQVGQQLREVGLGIDPVPLTGAGEAAEDGGGLAPAGSGHEEGVLAKQRDPFHLLLGQVVVNRHGPVGEEQGQLLPLVQGVADGLGQRMLGQKCGLLLQQ